MKILDTFLPLGETKAMLFIALTFVFLLGTPSTSHSQCDVNIFQKGTLSNGTVSLMPWLSYTNGCSLYDDCGLSKDLVVWDMEDLDPCEGKSPKANIENATVAVGSSLKSTDLIFTEGYGNSEHALAILKGQSIRFKVLFGPGVGQSGHISLLALNVKSITDSQELFCEREMNSSNDGEANYSITILSKGEQIYMGLKTVGASWDQEIIDLDYISESQNLFSETEPLQLEVIISNFTTTGDAALAIDNLLFEGKECLFENNLEYAWSTGETTERIYSIEKGNYCVTVTDCNGCQAVDCINVN